MHVIIISFIYLEAPHDVFTSLQLSTDCEQVETHLENVCVLSEVCVCVCVYKWTLVSLLCPFCFCFVFVSLMWTRPERATLTSDYSVVLHLDKRSKYYVAKLSKRTSKW